MNQLCDYPRCPERERIGAHNAHVWMTVQEPKDEGLVYRMCRRAAEAYLLQHPGTDTKELHSQPEPQPRPRPKSQLDTDFAEERFHE